MAKKIFTIFFIVLFVPFFFLTIILICLKGTLLNSNFLQSGLIKSKVYEQIVQKGLGSLVKTDENNDQFALGPISNDKVVEITQSALSADFIKNEVGSALSNFANYIKGNSNNLDFNISLTEPKTIFEKQMRQAIDEQWDDLPACTSGDFQSEEVLNCRVSGQTSKQFADELFNDQDGILSKIPDNLNAQTLNLNNSQFLNNAIKSYHLLDIVSKICLLATIVLFILIIVLNLKPPYVLLYNMGLPLAIASAITLIVTLVFHIIFYTIALANLKLGLPDNLVSLDTALIKATIGGFLVRVEIVSGIFVVVAIALLILSRHFFKKGVNQTAINRPQMSKPMAPKTMDSFSSKK